MQPIRETGWRFLKKTKSKRTNSPALFLLVHPLQQWVTGLVSSAFMFSGSTLQHLHIQDQLYPVAPVRSKGHSPGCCSWGGAGTSLLLYDLRTSTPTCHRLQGATGRGKGISPQPTGPKGRWGAGPDLPCSPSGTSSPASLSIRSALRCCPGEVKDPHSWVLQ